MTLFLLTIPFPSQFVMQFHYCSFFWLTPNLFIWFLQQVTWFINGVPVANDKRHKILVNEQGNNSLMITEASVQDSGVLTVVAKNKTGEATAQVRLPN